MKTQILALNSLEDKYDRLISAGMVLPYCVSDGYAVKTIRMGNAGNSGNRYYSGSPSQSVSSKTSENQSLDNQTSISKKAADSGNKYVKAAIEKSSSNTRRNLKRYLKERLKHESGVSPKVLNLINISGTVEQADCRIEDHYLAPQEFRPGISVN